jgi:protein-tyrosine phosphatase
LEGLHDFDIIFDLRSERNDLNVDSSIEHRRYPIADGSAPDEGTLREIATEINKRLARGDRIAVVCRLGRGRSATIVCAVLVVEGASLEDALAAVSRARRFIYINEKQRDALGRLAALESKRRAT